MGCQMTKEAYKEVIKGDIEYLEAFPDTLEKKHIIAVLVKSIESEYSDKVQVPSCISQEFIERMTKELYANQLQKGDWRKWKPDKLEALTELHYHMSKLLKAMIENNKELIGEYAADCGNHSMMIFENFAE